jgi:CRISPR-associated protein Csm5
MMKVFNLTLETLTPVHIGDSRGGLSGLDFFQDGQAVYLVNQKSWAKNLQSSGSVDEFVDYVAKTNFPALDDYLKIIGETRANHLRRMTPLRCIPKGEPLRLTNLHTLITDPLSKQPYFPGSSLKGAVRGALLYFLVGSSKKTAEIKDRVLRKTGSKWMRKRAGEHFDDLFQAGRKLDRSHSDFLRFLGVADAYSLQNECSKVREIKIISLNEERGYHYSAGGRPLFVETIDPGTKFKVQVRYDQMGLDIFCKHYKVQPPIDFAKWLELIPAKCLQLLEVEKNYFNRAGLEDIVKSLEIIESQGANLRLGWGSGLLGTAQVLHFSPEERRKLRSLFFQKRRHPAFPQSRKVVMYKGKPISTLGWVKVAID